MYRTFLKSKIHRATVTEANVSYKGSITIDSNLLKATDIAEYEKVQVADLSNGARLETYAIAGPAGSGMVCMNGAAAKCMNVGDLVIIFSYALLHEQEIGKFKPQIIYVDENNKITHTEDHSEPKEGC